MTTATNTQTEENMITEEMLDAYLEHAFEVVKKMFQEYGEDIFDSPEDYYNEYMEKAHDYVGPCDEELLELIVKSKFKKLKDLLLELEGLMDNVELLRIVKDDEAIWYIHIFDETKSLTTIILDKKGWKVHWGANTPNNLKSVILNAMN